MDPFRAECCEARGEDLARVFERRDHHGIDRAEGRRGGREAFSLIEGLDHANDGHGVFAGHEGRDLGEVARSDQGQLPLAAGLGGGEYLAALGAGAAEERKRMRQIGNVEVPQEAFLAVLKLDD